MENFSGRDPSRSLSRKRSLNSRKRGASVLRRREKSSAGTERAWGREEGKT